MRISSVLVVVAAAGCQLADTGGPCGSSAITKGPWVMRATTTGASLFWETRELGCIQAGVTPEAGGNERVLDGTAAVTTVAHTFGVDIGVKLPDLAGTYYVNHVDVTGLDPGRCYTWRVRQLAGGDGGVGSAGGGDDATGRLCTARPADQGFRFFAIGDTNPLLGHTRPVLDHTLGEKPEFAIHMGDIHYYSSTETWAYWFGAMAPLLRRGGAFFPAIGNHEDGLPGEYLDYYDRLFHQPSLDGTPKWYRFDWGGVWFHTVDTEEPYDSGSAQYMWLAASLKEVQEKPGFRFSVIYMHRNLYTLGDVDPQLERRMELSPQLVNHKVRLVLSGHMHGYERFEVGDITYVTTAGGGGVINDVNMNVGKYPMDAPLRVKAAPAYHAMLFDVTPMGAATSLRGRAIDEGGATIDDFTHLIP